MSLSSSSSLQPPPQPTPPTQSSPPKFVFIVPYRNREQQQRFFDRHMKQVILADMVAGADYEIAYIHQCDARSFNRGAMKNIGFLYVRDKWPDKYRQIILVFNDVDTMPFDKGTVDYKTTAGIIKHFYGYKFALGGFFSITAGDFERTGGFPCFFSWSLEDNALQRRAKLAGLQIDYSQFYPIFDKHIIQFVDSIEKTVNKKEYDMYKNDTMEGLMSLTNVQYQYDAGNGFVNVYHFYTGRDEDTRMNKQHNLLEGSRPYGNDGGIGARRGRGGVMKMNLGIGTRGT